MVVGVQRLVVVLPKEEQSTEMTDVTVGSGSEKNDESDLSEEIMINTKSKDGLIL